MPVFRVRLNDGNESTINAQRSAWTEEAVIFEVRDGSGGWVVVQRFDRSEIAGVQRRYVEFDGRWIWRAETGAPRGWRHTPLRS